MNSKIQILIIDDTPLYWMYLRKALKLTGIEAEIAECSDVASGIAQLTQHSFDCIILDYLLPDGNGLAVLEMRKKLNITTPVIVLTSQGREQIAVDLMKAGATDYIPKSALTPEKLGRSIKSVMYTYYMEKQIKQAEKLLRQSEEKYRSIFELSRDVIFITNINGLFLDVNRAGLETYGYTWAELQTMKVDSIYADPADRTKFINQIKQNGFVKDFSVTLKKKDGTLVYNLLTANIRNNPDGQVIIQGTLKDVTLSKMAEENLRQAHAQIHHLLGSISSILIGVSAHDQINQWNLAAEKCFGISSPDAIGQYLPKCKIPWDWPEIEKQYFLCKTNNTPVHLENLPYINPKTGNGLLVLDINPIQDPCGQNWGFVLLAKDITEQKRMESQLMLKQKLESIGQLAAGIAHEINTPMQYIGDNTRFLNDSCIEILKALKEYRTLIKNKNLEFSPGKSIAGEIDLDYLLEEIPRAIVQSLEGINRVSNLVLAMKDFSHPGREGKAFSDLNNGIEKTVMISKNEWKYVADLEFQPEPKLPPVYCSLDQINQVILNMIINSSHAIREQIDKGVFSKGLIIIRTEYQEPFVRISIRDNGKGIPHHIMHKIFDPFFTTKEVGKGTGQGLSLAHDIIVNKHHGSIEVNSEEGEGAIFMITLPVKDEGREEII